MIRFLRSSCQGLILLLAMSLAVIAPASFAQAISADAAAGIAAQATGGRVLGVSPNGAVYIVRVLLPGGVVREITVDANSGQVR